MKKIFKSVGSILLAGTLFLSSGCFFDKKDEKTYVVTFKQDGCEDISFKVLSGGSISNVPVPNNKEGYILTPDVSLPNMFDFIVKLEDTAKKTPDGYVAGGNKIKMGIPVVIEGEKYKYTGVISNVYEAVEQ